MFSGVRPSPGAATLGHRLTFEPLSTLEYAELAVAEDGHTPPNRYGGEAPEKNTIVGADVRRLWREVEG